MLIVDAISRGELKWVLTACAKVISENNLLMARWCMGVLRSMVSISGKPIQRLGGYMLEGFLARVAATGSIYKYLRSREPESYDFVSYEMGDDKMAHSKLQDNLKKLQGISLKTTEMEDTAKPFYCKGTVECCEFKKQSSKSKHCFLLFR
ncbi:unnamed protein product [Brassica oleracea]